MPAHVDQIALENILGVRRMQRIDLRVLGAVEIIRIVALNRLMEKRQPQADDQQQQRLATARAPRSPLDGNAGLQRPHFRAGQIANQFGELLPAVR